MTQRTIHVCINVDGTFYLVTDLVAKLQPHQNTIIAITLTNTVAAVGVAGYVRHGGSQILNVYCTLLPYLTHGWNGSKIKGNDT